MAGPLLDTNHDVISNKIDRYLIKESETFGFTFFVVSALMWRNPFANVLTVGVQNEDRFLDTTDYMGYVAKVFKKDTDYIAKLFIPHM